MRSIQEIAEDAHHCASSHEPDVRLIGNVKASEIKRLALTASEVGVENFLQELRDKSRQRSIEWNGHDDKSPEEILYRSNELGGESGEVQNAVKKYIRHLRGMKGAVDEETSLNDIGEEIADVIICCERLARLFEIDLEDVVRDKFNKTSDKYGLNTKFEE